MKPLFPYIDNNVKEMEDWFHSVYGKDEIRQEVSLLENQRSGLITDDSSAKPGEGMEDEKTSTINTSSSQATIQKSFDPSFSARAFTRTPTLRHSTGILEEKICRNLEGLYVECATDINPDEALISYREVVHDHYEIIKTLFSHRKSTVLTSQKRRSNNAACRGFVKPLKIYMGSEQISSSTPSQYHSSIKERFSESILEGMRQDAMTYQKEIEEGKEAERTLSENKKSTVVEDMKSRKTALGAILYTSLALEMKGTEGIFYSVDWWQQMKNGVEYPYGWGDI
jgi:hypothetical protein